LPQSNELPQRGQRALLLERTEDGFMTGRTVSPQAIGQEMMP
jgi:hypothetical protein